MLGNHADYFMGQQMRERVLAITPNGGGRSMQLPDRELAGTATVRVKAGWAMPGPQRTVGTDYAPGRSGALPGMGCCMPGMGSDPSGALPGMGGGALPGMSGGALPGMSGLSTKSMLGIGAAIIAGYVLLRKKR